MPDARVSLKLYRRLLALYPAGFRESYAGLMEHQFLDEMSESRGPFALAMLWIRILRDLAISVPVQFAREVRQDGRHALRLWSRVRCTPDSRSPRSPSASVRIPACSAW